MSDTPSDQSVRVGVWGTALICLVTGLWAASFIIGFETALTILTLTGYALACAGLRWPTLGLFGIGIICTLDPLTSNLLLTGGLLRWNTFNYWLLLVMALHIPLLLRFNDLHTRLVQLLILLLSLELAISPDPSRGMQTVLSALTLFGLLIYVARTYSDERNWLWLALVTGVLAASGGLTFYLQQNQLPYVNPNIWCFFPLTALFVICLYYALPNPARYANLPLLFVAIVNAIWVLLSGSRGGLLIALCCVFYLFVRLRSAGLRFTIVSAAVLLGVVITSYFPDLYSYALERLELLTNTTTSLRQRTSGRSELVVGGWYIFRDHPFGVGTGGFPKTWAGLGNLEGLGNFQRGIEFTAHATWIKILAENGVPGGLLLVGYVLSFPLVGWRRRASGGHTLGILTALVLGIAFTIVEFQWARGIWFLAVGATFLLNQQQIAIHVNGAYQRTPIYNIARLQKGKA